MTAPSSTPTTPTPGDVFVTTRWTLVVAAGREPTPESAQALEELCRAYWYPLYTYVRRQGHAREEAEDLVQGFFASFLAKNYLAGLNAERGRFRAFLLAALKHYLANERDRARAIKRGGGEAPLALDWQGADTRYRIDPADPLNPEKLYDREWALALLERVILRLREECAAAGKADLFAALKPFLTGGAGAKSGAQAAAELGLAEGAVRVAVHRLRRRYRELLRDEIGQTLADRTQIEEELQTLFGAFA